MASGLPMKKFATSLLAAALLLAGQAQAHHVWIEQDSAGAKLYFGEFGDNLREASPGLLDRFVQPSAQRLAGAKSQPLGVSKTANGFALSAAPGKGESLIATDLRHAIRERKEGDKTTRTLWTPGARLATDFGKQDPRLTLDLVPTGKFSLDSVELQLFYKGQPLPRTKVEVMTAAGWGQNRSTDEQGKLTVSLPWRGTYVLEVRHNDNTAGTRGDDKYDVASFVTSLTLVQGEGLSALPAPPAPTPNKMN